MKQDWITEDEKFSLLTDLVQKSLSSGDVLTGDEISPKEERIINEGVEQEVVEVDRTIICTECGKRYDERYYPDKCRCGYEFTGEEPTSVQYFTDAYPEDFKQVIDPIVDDFEIVYDQVEGLDDVPITELTPSTQDQDFLHLSPFLNVANKFTTFPGYSDVFLDWNFLPQLVEDPEEVMSEIWDFIETKDFNPSDLGNNAVENVHYAGPGAPGPEYTSNASWFTVLDEVDEKSEAKQHAETRFGESYNNLFEKIGVEFLHTLLPHAQTLHLGGSNKPDGLIQLNNVDNTYTYLVESKCYTSDFNIFSEEDKADRYVDNFIQNIQSKPGNDFNLQGYIFLATEFRDDKMPSDIVSLVDRTLPSVNLDIICINSYMMESSVSWLSRFYREEPSATYRIYENSKWYRRIIQGLTQYTEDYSSDPDHFTSRVLQTVKTMGTTTSHIEETLEKGFEPDQTWDEWREESQESIEEFP